LKCCWSSSQPQLFFSAGGTPQPLGALKVKERSGRRKF
jgi:hypothetical protein